VTHEPRAGEPSKVAVGLELGYAQGAGEDYVRTLDTEILARRDASWRGNSASEKQIQALLRWHVKLVVDEDGRAFLPDGTGPLTKGQASDLMSETIARRKARGAA
jgi:hypothetical protein